MAKTFIEIFRVGSEIDLQKLMNNFLFNRIPDDYYVCDTDVNVVLNGTKELWFGKIRYSEMDKMFIDDVWNDGEDEDLQPVF